MPMRYSWLMRLPQLVARHASLGLITNLPALTLTELWGLYCFLNGIVGGAT